MHYYIRVGISAQIIIPYLSVSSHYSEKLEKGKIEGKGEHKSMTVSRGKNILVLNQKRMVLSRP